MSNAPSVAQLAGLGQQFNGIAFGSFDSQEAADAGNALFAQNKDALDAIQSELEPFGNEQQEQIDIIRSNQPVVSPLKQLGQMLGFDPAQLTAEDKEELGQAFGFDPNAAVEEDSEEVAQAKELAVEAATAKLQEIAERAAPTFLKLQESIANLLSQALPEETFKNIVPEQMRQPEISEGFAANNAPALASAFAPRP